MAFLMVSYVFCIDVIDGFQPTSGPEKVNTKSWFLLWTGGCHWEININADVVDIISGVLKHGWEKPKAQIVPLFQSYSYILI